MTSTRMDARASTGTMAVSGMRVSPSVGRRADTAESVSCASWSPNDGGEAKLFSIFDINGPASGGSTAAHPADCCFYPTTVVGDTRHKLLLPLMIVKPMSAYIE